MLNMQQIDDGELDAALATSSEGSGHNNSDKIHFEGEISNPERLSTLIR